MAHQGPPASDCHGRVPTDSSGLFADKRQRVAPGLFNDMDRAYRAKFLKAQHLSARDQAYHLFYLWDNPEFRKARLNPLRRVWQAPGEAFERALRPAFGLKNAFLTKWCLSKSLWSLAAVWFGSYYFLYSKGDWTRSGGMRAFTSKPMTSPNNPHFPKPDPTLERHEPSDYYNLGFKESPTAAQLKPSLPTTW